MIGSQNTTCKAAANCALTTSLLVVCWLLSSASSLLAADSNRLAWSPSRDEAIVVNEFPGSVMPQNAALSQSLLAQRPRNLSRPAPARTRTYVADARLPGEPLPSVAGTPLSPDGLAVPTEMYYDEQGGVMQGGGSCDPCCNPCGPNCGGWGACVWIPLCVFIPRPPLDALEIFGGVQGFTGPANRGGSGSFGFHEGFNWGFPSCCCRCLAWQWGTNWTQSNFDGSYLTPDSRHQTFVTAGLFRRVDWGFQGGLVVDYLRDDWDYTAELSQFRGELSWLWCGRNELGVWFTAGLNDAENLTLRQPVFAGAGNTVTFADTQATLAVNELYAFFFRRQFDCGGQGRVFAGFTGHAQGLIGGDAQLPINACWSMRSSFTYVTPDDSDSTTDPRFTRESWNVAISLVWTPCRRPDAGPNYYRPLFNVADNGSFMTRLQ